MSDEYLVLMADDLSPSHELARALNLTDTEIDEILHSKNYPQDGIKVMKVPLYDLVKEMSLIQANAGLLFTQKSRPLATRKTLWEKKKMLVTSISFFFPQCFQPVPKQI